MKSVCERFLIESFPPAPNSIIGVARQTIGDKPTNGLRHAVNGTSNGWFLWRGEWSDADEFFQPLHVEHLVDYFPDAVPYLHLPPGYRFLVDDKGYEDVWFDETLLDL